MNYKETRPWGSFENLLESDFCKVKQIIVEPNHSLSYQYHYYRSEVWIVVQGVGEMRLEDKVYNINKGNIISIPVKAKHQIKNTGNNNLIFIEVQLGSSFDESDIVRLEDNYGRL